MAAPLALTGPSTDATPATAIEKAPRAEWPDAVRELAFELWMGNTGRAHRQLARLLATDYGIRISMRTLQDWETRFRWGEEADKRLALVAPAMRDETAMNLVANALMASRLQQQMLTDLGRGLPLPPDAKDRLTLVRDALAFGGFSATGQAKLAVRPPAPPDPAIPDGKPIPLADLIERHRRRIAGEPV